MTINSMTMGVAHDKDEKVEEGVAGEETNTRRIIIMIFPIMITVLTVEVDNSRINHRLPQNIQLVTDVTCPRIAPDLEVHLYLEGALSKRATENWKYYLNIYKIKT